MNATKKTKKQKIDDDRIARIYSKRCSGVQINVLDINKVFNVGRKLVDDGADDQTIGDGIAEFVETIRVN